MDEQEKTQEEISWTHLPLYRSLTEYILFLNVPRSFLVWDIGSAIFILLMFGTKFWYVLLLNVLAYFVVRYFTLEDSQFFDCFSKYWTKKDYYST